MTRTIQSIALAWCCLGGIASGQAPARDMSAQALAPPSGTGALSGAVVDPEGKPVRRALVRAVGDMRLERSNVTDDEGKFSFADLPSGRFTVSAEKTGYPRISYGAKRPFRAGSGLYLQEGQKVTGLTLTLAPGSGMTGVVYDDRGEPMPGVPVQAWEVRTSLSGERTIESPSAGVETTYVTDEQGRYRIYGLAPGDYVLGTAWFYHGQPYDVRLLSDAEIRAAFQTQGAAAAGPAAAAPAASSSNYAPSFAPGVVDPLSAGVHSLAAGEMKTGVDLRMQFQAMSSLDAQIVNPDGTTAASRITLMRRLRVEALNTMQVTSATDRYRSGSLSPGDYTLMAQLPPQPGKPSLWAAADFVASGGDPVTLSLFLQPAISVKGTVRFEGTGKPPTDVSRVNVRLRNQGRIDPESVTTIDPAGTMEIAGLVPGRYTVFTSVPAGISGGATWTVRSVTINGQDVTDRPFDVPPAGLTNVVVTFSDVASEISGTITAGGRPATDYFVIAIPADRAFWFSGSRRIANTRPDGSGRYLFRGLPAGDYRIAVTTDLVPRDLQDVSSLEQLLGQSVPVTIGVGEKKQLDLKTAGGGQ
jgi:hypothetical protein